MRRLIFCLGALFTGCTDFYSNELSGAFAPVRFSFKQDSCGLENTIAQMGLTYNFGGQPQPWQWDSGARSGNLSEDMWSGCYMDTSGGPSGSETFPNFRCYSSLLAEQLDVLYPVVVEQGICSENQEPSEAVYSRTEGMFVNKDKLVLGEELNFNCYDSWSLEGSYQSCRTHYSVELKRLGN